MPASHVVVVWNLLQTYSTSQFCGFLFECDFDAVAHRYNGHLALDGVLSTAFIFYFREVWHARCFVACVNESKHLRAKRPGEAIRAALWQPGPASWSSADVPSALSDPVPHLRADPALTVYQ